jgi:glutamate-ammonia-ligase adenylyltransferase
MSPGSDLDLVMIYELDDLYALSDSEEKPLASPTYHLRLTQRVVAAITAKTAEGALYEIDMRLRPSGSTGPLAVSIEAFERYQREEAWTWEHMALTRARPIAGPPALAARIEAVVREILATPRDEAKLLQDVADMRLRIDAQHHTADPWDLKYVRGGQIDIEFIAQYLQLRHAAAAPQILSPNTGDALDALAANGFLDEPTHAALSAAHRLYQTVQGFLRLTLDRPADMADAPPALLRSLGRILAQVFGDPSLETDPDLGGTGAAILAGRQRRIGAIYERIIGPLAPPRAAS